MENKNGQGIFYGVIGVATLIVAIIGATFAYFGASNTNNTTITGNTASAASIGLTVTQSTTTPNTNTLLVPLDVTPAGNKTSQLAAALGHNPKCVDDNESHVCVIYKVTVTNDGNAAVQVRGTLNLASAATGMKWSLLSDEGSANSFPAYSTIQSVGAAQPLTVAGNVTATPGTGKTEASLTLAAEASKDFYVLVWLEEAGDEQSDPDANKGFTGTVTFNATDANGNTSGVTATFNG